MMPETPEARGPRRVLVVDDSAPDRLMAVRALTRAFRGLQVDWGSTSCRRSSTRMTGPSR
ncbi:MAG TPA: hypothetical protein VFZ09_02135 [Archangium sp.]|uniref:hypothetical protein n=1 Tax=Archangium sp. TaxID=1872627 RepID=UPI002E329E76|nr:hypothetical protein [Archangium sp.]HEX5745010.1 hypothetical protein [Archangium sp.]